jgi:hypothetical protein
MPARKFAASSSEEVQAALEYFNGFHDGFMKRIVLVSQDRMEADGSQTVGGRFDVEVDFAHYNYADGERPLHPASQLVRARFEDVQDIFCDLRAGFLGNTIMSLSVHQANRRIASSDGVETCLALQWARQFYQEEYRRFETRQSQLFTFARALFEEVPG